MNFDFEKFRDMCTDIRKVMDLRAEADRKAFTMYMKENNIKYTDQGRCSPFVYFVWFYAGGAVFGTERVFPLMTIYSFQDFLLPELSMDDILDFLEV